MFLRDALVINAEQALAQQFITEIADEVTGRAASRKSLRPTPNCRPGLAHAQLEGDAADQHR